MRVELYAASGDPIVVEANAKRGTVEIIADFNGDSIILTNEEVVWLSKVLAAYAEANHE